MQSLVTFRKYCKTSLQTGGALQELIGLGKQWSLKQEKQCYFLY